MLAIRKKYRLLANPLFITVIDQPASFFTQNTHRWCFTHCVLRAIRLFWIRSKTWGVMRTQMTTTTLILSVLHGAMLDLHAFLVYIAGIKVCMTTTHTCLIMVESLHPQSKWQVSKTFIVISKVQTRHTFISGIACYIQMPTPGVCWCHLVKVYWNRIEIRATLYQTIEANPRKYRISDYTYIRYSTPSFYLMCCICNDRCLLLPNVAHRHTICLLWDERVPCS